MHPSHILAIFVIALILGIVIVVTAWFSLAMKRIITRFRTTRRTRTATPQATNSPEPSSSSGSGSEPSQPLPSASPTMDLYSIARDLRLDYLRRSSEAMLRYGGPPGRGAGSYDSWSMAYNTYMEQVSRDRMERLQQLRNLASRQSSGTSTPMAEYNGQQLVMTSSSGLMWVAASTSSPTPSNMEEISQNAPRSDVVWF